MTMTDIPDLATATTEPPQPKGKKAKKAKGGRSNLVPALVLAGGIAAGGWFMGGGSGADPASTTTVTEAPEVVEGPFVALDALTVNLAGGRYVRVGVALQLSDTYEDAVEGDDGEALAHHDASRVRDVLIASLGGRDAGELTTAEGRERAKDELLDAVGELLDGSVMEVYFTELVIQ